MNTRSSMIRNAVLQRLEAHDDFTASDVFNSLQDANLTIRYRDVAETIREMFEDGAMTPYNYDRRLTDVTVGEGWTVKAYLYHPTPVRLTLSSGSVLADICSDFLGGCTLRAA